MSVLTPKKLTEACEQLANNPQAHVLAGGTDFMVEVNYRHRSPETVVAINQIDEIAGWQEESETIWIGSNMTYTEMANPDFAKLLPALSQAARTVGSPQIRNAGTLGGNLATASPAGDTLPALTALEATVLLQSASGKRETPIGDFIVGVKQTTLGQDEIIEGVRIPKAPGRSEFLKIGTRNAMVISVASLALFARQDTQQVCVGLGSVAAVPVKPTKAEEWISQRLDWQGNTPPSDQDATEFASLVAESATPIDDHRSTADYRRKAVEVMAKRALLRTFQTT